MVSVPLLVGDRKASGSMPARGLHLWVPVEAPVRGKAPIGGCNKDWAVGNLEEEKKSRVKGDQEKTNDVQSQNYRLRLQQKAIQSGLMV